MSLLFACLLVLVLLVSPVHADVDFDGNDDFLATGFPLSTFISAATGATVMGWIFVQGSVVDMGTCWQGAGLSSDLGGFWAMGRMDNTTWCGYAFDGADHLITSASSAGWHHIGMTLGFGALTLWVDGVEVATTIAGAPTDLSGTVLLGRSAEGFISDRLTEILYFNVPLSDAEMERHGKSRIRLVPSTVPTGHWPMDTCAEGSSGDGATFPDRSGNERHATGDNGGDDSGLTCRANGYLAYPWGVH